MVAVLVAVLVTVAVFSPGGVLVMVGLKVFVGVLVKVLVAPPIMTKGAMLSAPPNTAVLFSALSLQLTVTATLKCASVVIFILSA